MIADVALGHGAALRKWHYRGTAHLVVGVFKGQVDHADLRPVAMSDHDLIALFGQVNDGAGGFLDQFQLLLGRVAQRIAA